MAIEIVELPIKNGAFQYLCKRLLEGIMYVREVGTSVERC